MRAEPVARGVLELNPTQPLWHTPLGATWTSKHSKLGRGWRGTGAGGEGEALVRSGGRRRCESILCPCPFSLWESGCKWGRCDAHQCCLSRGICEKWAQQRPDAQSLQRRRGRFGRTMADQVLSLFWFRRERSMWE